jgi:NAD(P)-dependent dehydrogenase (short-subunit alcohol dehydrogenase family)
MHTPFNADSTADQVLADASLTGRRYLITGVASGIGRETARALVARGATVVGTVKDSAAAEARVAPIRQAAGEAGGAFELLELDLASLRSVRAGADVLLSAGLPFDAVIANAGVMATPFSLTEYGFESQFAINYLGHFALVEGIVSLMQAGSRLIVLSSQAHRVADVDLADPHFAQHAYEPFVAYGRSKTALTLYAAEFDRRHRAKGIRAAAVMPGNSLTDLPRNFTPEQLQDLFATVGKARADAGLPPGQLKTIEQAAATSVWAAVVADGAAIGGRYLEDCAVAPVNDSPNPFADGVRSYALDPAKAAELWTRSSSWVHAEKKANHS